MALTTLDPNSALIIVDLQNGLRDMPTVHPMANVVTNAAALAEAFRRHGQPVVLVNVNGSAPGRTEQPRRSGNLTGDATEIIPALNPQPEDHRVTKQTWGAFTNTGLRDHLERLGVTQVVIAGVATSIGAESTARQAHECGFHVTLAVDAMTDLNPDAHLNSVTRIFPRLGETGTTEQILDLLDKTHTQAPPSLSQELQESRNS